MSKSCKKLCGITHVEPHSEELTTQDVSTPQSSIRRIPQQAESDEQLIKLWLHGRSKHTIKGYTNDIKLFFQKNNKFLKAITLQDLQDYTDYLTTKEYAPATIKRMLCAVKSLFSFGFRIGYLQFDVGKPLRIPTPKETISERILSQQEVFYMFDCAKNPRDKMLLKLLYYTGLRVSEISGLKFSNLQAREKTGQITVQTKGDKTNVILLPTHLWEELSIYRNGADEDCPIIKSRKGNALCVGQIQRVVSRIAIKAGITGKVSPHWLRHSHASHALDNGCPIHLVQKQLSHTSIATTGKYLHARPTESSSKYLK
ncbi:MAG: integrase [Candidatus Aenigmatarchaeota archaeon]|nr:MAG: integrase [Candidatus Aenigmarchaeota archaeon]